MKSHSFTTEDAAKQDDIALKSLTYFDPKYDNNSQISTELNQYKEQFNLDINRGAKFYIETPAGTMNLVDNCKAGKEPDYKVTYEDMHKSLTSEYKLSTKQTEYILAASHQGSIAGGLTGFSETLGANIADPMYLMNRNGNMSKIIIDKDNNLSYVGGQKIIFDCNMATYSGVINNTVHTEFSSKDYVASNITAKVGKVGEVEFKPQVMIDVAGDGEVGQKIVKQLQDIKSELPPRNPQLIVKDYHDFSNNILQNAGDDKLYKQAVTAEVGKILSAKPADIDHETVESLKKLEFTKEALAEIVMDRIDTRINEFKKDSSKPKITSKDIGLIADEATDSLQKFVGKSKGYLERFTKDLVQQRTESSGIEVPKKNFVEKIVSYLKDLWHGYSKDTPEKSTDAALDQVKLQAKEIGKGVNILPEGKGAIAPPQSKTSSISKNDGISK